MSLQRHCIIQKSYHICQVRNFIISMLAEQILEFCSTRKQNRGANHYTARQAYEYTIYIYIYIYICNLPHILFVQGAVKMLLIICILGSVNIFNFLGLQEPSWWTWCTRNKLYSCIMIFFVCNAVEGQLLSTGAFEISMNGKEMY